MVKIGKFCSKCKTHNWIWNFHKDGTGRRSECKSCTSVKDKSYRITHLEQTKRNCRNYRAAHKEDLSQYSKWYRAKNELFQKEQRRQRHLAYPEIKKEIDRKYRQTHREEIKERYRIWMNTDSGRLSFAKMRHKRKSALNKTECTLTLKQWNRILEMQHHRCNGCGELFSEKLKPTKDHIIPLSLKGGLTFGNTQALCKPCNSSKKNNFEYGPAIDTVIIAFGARDASCKVLGFLGGRKG